MNQIIIHVDMDAFYASVEIRDNRSLKGKPLIIGSLPNERGVVATCSYEARKYGIHSGMTIKEAYRLCPSGIYMHPNFQKYKDVSERLHEIWNDYATALETVALDEAYLDVTQSAKTFERARKIAHTIKRRTQEELGLGCSVGVAYSKTAAKTASEEKKPNGYFEIPTPKDFINLIIDRDVRVLYTVGEKTAKKLNAAGIRTVFDVRERQQEVIRLLGKHGLWLTQIAFGIDNRRVVPYLPQNAKSISRELTFQKDVDNDILLKDVLFLLALCVDNRAKRYGLYGKGVSLKITFSDMKSITRSKSVITCDHAVTIYREAIKLFEQITKRPIRLIGVGIYNLSRENVRQLSFDDLLEETEIKHEAELKEQFAVLNKRYNLDFEGNLAKLYQNDTLHKTAEYMRKHS